MCHTNESNFQQQANLSVNAQTVYDNERSGCSDLIISLAVWANYRCTLRFGLREIVAALSPSSEYLRLLRLQR